MLANTGEIDLSGGWTTVWNAISGPLATFTTFLTAVGVIIIVMAVLKFLWDKRRGSGGGGGGQGASSIGWAIALGAVLAGPNLILPLVLEVVDIFANAAINLIKTGAPGS
jgi:hypothetical protein